MKTTLRLVLLFLLCLGNRYACAQTALYVDSARAGSGTGGSWAQAYKTLGEALNVANAGTGAYNIHMARGTYYPTGAAAGTNRDTAYALNRGNIKLYGGYPSGGVGARNITTYPVILSGNINNAGLATDNSYHIMVIANIAGSQDSLVVDGITFRDAVADGTGSRIYNAQVIEQSLGGAVHLRAVGNNSRTVFRNCFFIDNTARHGGGAIIANISSSFTVSDCMFSGNRVTATGGWGGGAIMIANTSMLTNVRSVFYDNSCATNGGAIYFYASGMMFQYNCLLANNHAAAKGGGYYLDNGSYAEMANNTIYGNAAINSDGGAIYSEGDVVIDNTIFYRNTMYNGGSIPVYTADGSDIANMGSSVFLSNSSLQFDVAASARYTGYTYTGNSWVSNIYPQFLDSANKRGADNTWATADDGLSLVSTSNMINAGLNAAVIGMATQGDLARAARIQLNTVDMGAYESAVAFSCPVGNTVYVDSSIAVSGSGGNWTGAFKTLHEAMAIADRCSDITHILVAKGTYFPTPDQNRDSAIVVRRANIKIYGGYPSGGGSRNITANPTIIDGDIGGGNYSYHLLVIAGIYTTTDSIVLDGLTLRNARADGGNVFRTYNGETLERMYGGGIYLRNVRNGHKTIFRNCTFSNNLATNGGGAIMNNVYSGAVIESCRFNGNTNTSVTSIYGGGAVFSASNSVSVIRASTFTGNSSATSGGAIFQNDTSLTVINCTFKEDTAAAGGAICLINNSSLYSRYNLFLNNIATNGHGGAIYANHTGQDTLANNVFADNKCTGSSNNGGGAAALLGSRSYTVNNTFYADSARGYSGALMLSGTSAVYNNIFYKCYAPAGQDVHVTGTHTAGNNSFSNTDPAFHNEANLAGGDNTWFTGDDGLRLKNFSPVLNTGDNSKIPANISTDITGAVRVQHIVEPGAYEGYICTGNRVAYVDSSVGASGDGTSWATAYKTLAEVIDATRYCNSIDTVLVAKGTYFPTGLQSGNNRDTVFRIMRRLKIYGGFANGTSGTRNSALYTTRLSGNIGNPNDSTDNSNHVVTIDGTIPATDSIVLDGMIIQGGYANTHGGAVYLAGNSGGPKVAFREIRFERNTALGNGGAVYEELVAPSFVNCVFSNNQALGDGGAVFSSHATPVFTGSRFQNNKALAGGAISSIAAVTALTHCSFSGNEAANGGALHNTGNANTILTNNTFNSHTATVAGGVVYQDTGTIILNRSRFTGNTAHTGGVLYLTATARLQADACIFNENNSTTDGGVFRMNNIANDTVYNSLFIHNKAAGDGSSVYTMQANKYFGNNTFYADTASGGTGATAFVQAGNILVNSIFYKTRHDISGTYTGGFNSLNNTNPLFINEANPAGADGILGTVDDGLRLLLNSPAIDSGDNTYIHTLNTTDLTGKPRIHNGIVDRGAYEGAAYAQHILYVDHTKNGDGKTWDNALRYLSDAFHLANQYNNIDSILVARGTYYATGSSLGSNRDSAFVLTRGGIKVLGGFPTGGGTRDVAAYATILEGRLFGAADGTLHVLVLAGITATEDSIRIDGLTIRNAYGGRVGTNAGHNIYNGQPISRYDGGGICFLTVANGQKTVIANCLVQGNYADGYGGGAYIYRSSPSFVNCMFNKDSTNGYGGAVYCNYSDPIFTHCSFSNCIGPGYGGAFFNQSSSPVTIGCNFTNNRSIFGGAICNDAGSFPVIDSCSFNNNTATFWGGAIADAITTGGFTSPASMVSNSRFTGNSAGMYGGAVYNSAPANKPSAPVYKNCSFTANTAPSGGAIYSVASGVPLLESDTFTGNTAQYGGAIYYSQTNNPVIKSSSFRYNKAGSKGGAVFNYISDNSISNSIFTGNKADTMGGAIYQQSARLALSGNVFEADTAQQGGAVYYLYGGSTLLNGNAFTRNIATNGGGGAVYFNHTSMFMYDSLVNNIFHCNKDIGTVNSYGGALYYSAGTTRLINNTFYGDSANTAGGAIYATYTGGNTATLNMYNNIFYKSAGGALPDTAGIGRIVQSNNSFGSTNPLFANEADAAGPDNIWGTADDGLQLIYASPMLNTGDNTKVPTVAATDIKGTNRMQQATVDLGAYEGPFDACNAFRRLYVNAAAPASLGGSWAYPMNNLNTALSLAGSCNDIREIWVAAGTYKPAAYPVGHSSGTGNRRWSFGLVSGVKLLGGFNGTETDVAQRSFVDNPTILSGNIGDTLANTDNCYHVVISAADNDQTSIDGFIIEDGYASDLSSGSVDGQFVATNSGGGMALLNTRTSVANCIFRNNTSRFASQSNYGDAIFITAANNTIDNCIFHNNISYSVAGGAVHSVSGSVRLNNCVFHNNQVALGGNGAYALANCTFTSQTSNIISGTGTYHLYNSILWNNASNLFGSNTPTITHSIVQGGGYTTDGNSSADPRFNNLTLPAGADGKWFTADDGLQLQRCSPAINQGRTSANSTLLDVANQPRVFNTTIDIGAYEYQALPDAPSLAQHNDSASRALYPGVNGLTTLNCRVIAQVLPNGSSPVTGHAFARTMLDSSVQQYNGINYVQRHYDITPDSNAATATARLTLFFTQDEFDAYNLVNAVKLPVDPSDVAGKDNLRIWQHHGTSATGTPGTYTGTDTLLHPDNAAIVWNSTDSRWGVSFNVTGFSGFFVTTRLATPLPVQLVSFTGSKDRDDKHALLEWTVARETDMSAYKLQRSSNGSIYETIGVIIAAGKERYQFTDRQPLPGVNFYRLSLEQSDGDHTYSQTLRLVFGDNNRPGIVVYPNPASRVLNISTEGIAAGLLTLQYTDLAGRTARTIQVNYIPGEVMHDDISTLSAGAYILTLPGKPVTPIKITVIK